MDDARNLAHELRSRCFDEDSWTDNPVESAAKIIFNYVNEKIEEETKH